MKKLILTTALLTCAVVAKADEFYPISNIGSSTASTDLWPVSNLIQGPGAGYDANAPHDKLVSGAAGNWVTAAPGGFPSDYIAVAGAPVLTIDLGIDRLLAEISLWGYEASNANGPSAFALRFATDTDGPSGFGTSVPDALNFAGLANDTILRQSFSFNPVSARYVELTITDNFFIPPGDGSNGTTPGGDRVGLGEVAFMLTPVPEPSTLALLAGGIALIGLYRIRRRKA